MITKKIKVDAPEPQPRVIQEVEKNPKSDIIVERTSTHKYTNCSITKRVNYVTPLEMHSTCLKRTQQKKHTHTHIGIDYFACVDPKKETITMEPIANNIHFENKR